LIDVLPGIAAWMLSIVLGINWHSVFPYGRAAGTP